MKKKVRPWWNKWRNVSAFVLTSAWLVVALWWTFYKPCGAWAVPPLDLNEWGDWASGTFAPLAFLWLTVGYFQQGEELSLQAEELRNSVEQQTNLAASTNQHAELAVHAQVADYQPEFTDFIFNHRNGDTGNLSINITLKNMRALEVILHAALPPGMPGNSFSQPRWDPNQTIGVLFGPVAADAIDVEMRVDYKDALYVSQVQWFRVYLQGAAHGQPLKVSLIGVTARLPPLRK